MKAVLSVKSLLRMQWELESCLSHHKSTSHWLFLGGQQLCYGRACRDCPHSLSTFIHREHTPVV
uniref:Uncharacterized protein n=1 Tax=Anguilla anguilla TaxID=7936 RepID=A0A0E9VJK0_ANGAN